MTERNPIEQICSHFAEKLADAPGRARLARLARTARRIPAPLLADLTALIVQLDDVELVGSDIALQLIDIAFCDLKYVDAVHFVSALKKRLQRYIDNPAVANNARGDFHDRARWWGMALGRAAELCRWPAIVLTRTHSTDSH